MIDRETLLKKISSVNEENEKLFGELGLLPNLIFSFNEDENMVLEENFSYGPEGRKGKVTKITPEEFIRIFFEN
jgi:hypothetical protein